MIECVAKAARHHHPKGRSRLLHSRSFRCRGELISTSGAGTRSWRWAFELLHGMPADIGEFSEAGMTDPEVARSTFRNVIGRQRQMARLLAADLERLPLEVEASE